MYSSAYVTISLAFFIPYFLNSIYMHIHFVTCLQLTSGQKRKVCCLCSLMSNVHKKNFNLLSPLVISIDKITVYVYIYTLSHLKCPLKVFTIIKFWNKKNIEIQLWDLKSLSLEKRLYFHILFWRIKPRNFQNFKVQDTNKDVFHFVIETYSKKFFVTYKKMQLKTIHIAKPLWQDYGLLKEKRTYDPLCASWRNISQETNFHLSVSDFQKGLCDFHWFGEKIQLRKKLTSNLTR